MYIYNDIDSVLWKREYLNHVIHQPDLHCLTLNCAQSHIDLNFIESHENEGRVSRQAEKLKPVFSYVPGQILGKQFPDRVAVRSV